jgi:hypothetical protein
VRRDLASDGGGDIKLEMAQAVVESDIFKRIVEKLYDYEVNFH